MDKRFEEVANEWFNSGGHCMVDITTVYDKQLKRLLYVVVSDDDMAIYSHDVVREEIPGNIEADELCLWYISRSDWTTDPMPLNFAMTNMPEDYFDLFDHGLLSHIKNKYKYDRQLTHTTVESLPLNLIRAVPQEYANWLCDNDTLITTDGEQIIYDRRYEYEMYDCNGKAAVKFKRLLEKMRSDADIDDDHLAVFEDEKINLIINGQVFTLQMCAAVWNGLIDYADYIISEQ